MLQLFTHYSHIHKTMSLYLENPLQKKLQQFFHQWFTFISATGSVLPQNNIDSVEGTKTILPCGRDPIDPKATILWTKGGQDVRSKNRFSVEGGSNLTIRDTERNDAGLYQCSSRTLSPSGAAITVAHNMYLNVQCKSNKEILTSYFSQKFH